MSRIFYAIITCVYFLIITSCQTSKYAMVDNAASVQLKSGIAGSIRELTGNMMPLQTKSKRQGKPLQTQLLIFKQLSASQLVGLSEQWCKQVNAIPIKTQWSDSVGNYQILLEPAKYSILVAYDGGYFIPFFNQSNEISTIDIVKSQMLRLDIKVNRKAIY
jgi:hypothetical protein